MLENFDEIFFNFWRLIKKIFYKIVEIPITGWNNLPWYVRLLVWVCLTLIILIIGLLLYKSYKKKEWLKVKAY